MAPYIGTTVSRVDGVAKVTGAAKYAAEVNVPGLVYGSIVGATIAKGSTTCIDASAASPGSVILLPGNTSHFHWAKSGEYITQVTAIGPLGLQYLDPADDPREHDG